MFYLVLWWEATSISWASMMEPSRTLMMTMSADQPLRSDVYRLTPGRRRWIRRSSAPGSSTRTAELPR